MVDSKVGGADLGFQDSEFWFLVSFLVFRQMLQKAMCFVILK